MTAEQLVPDVETCIRLKDAGFPQDTNFVWVRNVEPQASLAMRGYLSNEVIAAAPLMEEILEVLPGTIEYKNYKHWLEIDKYHHSAVDWGYRRRGEKFRIFGSPSLPALYLKLKEQGLI